tara:strand:- start:311 stop:1093 length:783 start_codon:yes stop_codon:yes gene_type:complete
MKNIILMLLFNIFIIVNISASDHYSDINDIKTSNPENILFIGNSYLYYNDSLHNHFKRIVEERVPGYDGSSSIKSATIGGSRLKHHNLDHLLKPYAISNNDHFDLVILQGGSGESLSKKDRDQFSKLAKKHIDKIKLIGSDAALYMIHAYVKPHKSYSSTLIRVIERMYTKAGKDNNVLVIPVGLAFENAYNQRPSIKLHKIDGTHPDILGTYLAACVVYASIYKDNPIGISYDYNGAINSEDMLFLQTIAHETVQKYLN